MWSGDETKLGENLEAGTRRRRVVGDCGRRTECLEMVEMLEMGRNLSWRAIDGDFVWRVEIGEMRALRVAKV